MGVGKAKTAKIKKCYTGFWSDVKIHISAHQIKGFLKTESRCPGL